MTNPIPIQSHGSIKSADPSLMFKPDNSSSKKNESVLKYVANKSSKEDSTTIMQNSRQSNSSSLGEIKYLPVNDDMSKDFRTPKPIKVRKKCCDNRAILRGQSKLKSKPRSSKSKSVINKNPIFRATQDNFALLDMNPDHLQMALALSNSTYAVEYPELSKNIDVLPTFVSSDKIPKRKTTLERYGFNSVKPKIAPELKREPSKVIRNKNSKFRFITPTLKNRTVEERQSIIASKISLVLCSNENISCDDSHRVQYFNDLCSDILINLKGSYSIFAANGYSLQESIDKYYNKNLNISPTRSKCGCLLKKWEDIPGRQKSPNRWEFKSQKTKPQYVTDMPAACLAISEYVKAVDFQFDNQREKSTDLSNVDINSTSASQNISVEYSTSRDCISPDLFESDSDTEFTPKSSESENRGNDYSQSLLSPSKKQKTGCQSSLWSLEAREEITVNVSQNNTKKSLESSSEHSEDEDTEELYLNCVKGELIGNLTQNSPSKQCKEELLLVDKDSGESDLHFFKTKGSIIDLTFSSSSNDSHYSVDKISEKLNVKENLKTSSNKSHTEDSNVKDSDTNFDMSLLHLKESENVENEEVTDFIMTASNKHSFLYNADNSKFGRVNQILTEYEATVCKGEEKTNHIQINNYCNEKHNNHNLKTVSTYDDNLVALEDRENTYMSNSQDGHPLISSQESCSQESIVLSDEELNYSSIHSKHTKCKKNFYDLSEDEEVPKNSENTRDLTDVQGIFNVHSVLKNKYGNKNISTPIHSRISELRLESSLIRTSSITKAFLEDSFNEVLENSNILKAIESEADKKMDMIDSLSDTAQSHYQPTVESVESKSTPEKCSKILIASAVNSDTTPENNLIIKIKDITPLTNYDEMDTPKIKRELNKFGLKPLKRQRGVKLLKYLYECTHPMVGPGETEECSSDEDDKKRITKKRKKSSNTNLSKNNTVVKQDDFGCNPDNIEIIGDTLLKNENLNELIFERKYSVRIPSCRIPLQIVWHNFLSKNAHIKENILLYEPLQLEVLHAMIKEQTGCKFHIQDLLTFFDRKCITIRTAQGSQGGKRTTKF